MAIYKNATSKVDPDKEDDDTSADDLPLSRSNTSVAANAHRVRQARANQREDAEHLRGAVEHDGASASNLTYKQKIDRQKRIVRSFKRRHSQLKVRIPYHRIDSRGYAAFVEKITEWVSLRVMSRTKVVGKDGKKRPIKRENQMM